MNPTITIARRSDDDYIASVLRPTGSDKIGEMFVELAFIEGFSEAEVRERALAIASELFSGDEFTIVIVTADDDE